MQQSRKGLALIICAPSGAGKTTLAKRLLAEFENLDYSVSCTTRPARAGEIEGKDYYFIDKKEFITRRDNNEFIEWAKVHGNYYGTLRDTVKQTIDLGKDLLFDIDVQGAAQMRLNLPLDAVFAFIAPPSIKELESRLIGRGTDSAEVIAKRVANAKGELANAHWYDFIIVNDELDLAYEKLRSVYTASALTAYRQASLLNNLFKEANQNG